MDFDKEIVYYLFDSINNSSNEKNDLEKLKKYKVFDSLICEQNVCGYDEKLFVDKVKFQLSHNSLEEFKKLLIHVLINILQQK